MKNLNLLVAGTLSMVGATSCGGDAPKEVAKQPNIIYILADDMGIGDLGCYGQDKILTPNIDKLAASGMQFTDHYAGCTVSAPSRCVLMTGVHTGHSFVRGNREMPGQEGQYPMDSSLYTVAEMLSDAGYATGAFGKWGLGYPGSEGDPNFQGFQEFFGYNCQRMAHRYYAEHLWDNQEKYILEGNDLTNKVTFAPDVIHERALEFIKSNKDKPFFAYVPIVQPHAETLAPDDEILAMYKGKFKEEHPYVAPQPNADYGTKDLDYMHYCSQPEPRTHYAAMVTRVDKYVGDIVALVNELGIADNTLIIFTSDNGVHIEGGADPDFFNGNAQFRGYKRDITDGGIRVPMIASWKGKIAEGTKNNTISAFWDMLPTFAEMAGVEAPKGIDGVSILPTLTGDDQNQKQHDFLYWETNAVKPGIAVRMGEWKAIRYCKGGKNLPVELYNIVTDTEELNNVAEQNPEVVAQVTKIMDEQHVESLHYPMPFDPSAKAKATKKK